MAKSKLAKKIGTPAKAKFDPSTLGKLPVGMHWVYNRLSKPYSIVFDGHEEVWDAHECRMVHSALAAFAEHRSIYRLDPVGLHNVMVLVGQTDLGFGKPLPAHVEDKGDELIIRDGQIAPKDVETIKID